MSDNHIYENPEQLTVKKLKQELHKHGVPAPKSALKAEFIRLYENKVLKRRPHLFSSDEEEETSNSETATLDSEQAKVTVQLTKLNYIERMTVDGVDVGSLSNTQLSNELKRRGYSIGPVGPTTRRLYERKLENALRNGAAGDRTTQVRYSDQESASEESEEVEEERVVVATRKSRTSILQSSVSRGGSATRRRAMRAQEMKQEEEESRQQEEEEEEKFAPVPSSGGKQETLKSERRWLPVWIQILIVFLLAGFIYLVIQSMEANPRKMIPKTKPTGA